MLTSLMVVLFISSCVKDGGATVPDNGISTETPTPTPEPTPMPEPTPQPTPEPTPGPTPEPTPEPEETFRLRTPSVREVNYNGCEICGEVITNLSVIVEIPEDCDWIKPFHGYDSIERQGRFGLSIGSLPQTLCPGSNPFEFLCSGEERECVITIWDTYKEKSVQMTVRQKCYACSGFFDQVSDVIVEF